MESIIHLISFAMELNELIALLNTPDQLHLAVEKLRTQARLDDDINGFIALYDTMQGDCKRIQHYLEQTKEHVLRPLALQQDTAPRYRLVAALLALIGIGGLLLYIGSNQEQNRPKAQQQTAQLFREPGIPIFMSESYAIDWAPLMFALDEGTSKEALNAWEEIYTQHPSNDTLIYFGGIIHQKLKHKKKASYYFEQNAKSGSVFADRSIYFLFQMAKSEGNKQKAIRLLNSIKGTQDLDLKPFIRAELNQVHLSSQ